MPDHLSHGRPYLQPERHDELSDGVPRQDAAGDQRRPDGTLAQGARAIPSLGGKAHKGRTRLSHRIDAPTLTPTSQSRARTLRRALSGEIAATVGGGHSGIAASLSSSSRRRRPPRQRRRSRRATSRPTANSPRARAWTSCARAI